MAQIVEISKRFTFEASHVLPKHPGKCSRLHGHSWNLEVILAGLVNKETGFVLDYAELKAMVGKYVVDVLDHNHLGCGDLVTFPEHRPEAHYAAIWGPGFYPSSENLVVAISRILLPLVAELPSGGGPQSSIILVSVSLDETCTSTATWRNLKYDTYRQYHP